MYDYSGSGDEGSASSSAANLFSRGVPGERVTPEDSLLLELRPFRVYRVGEIVAYEVPEDSAMSSSQEAGAKALNQDTKVDATAAAGVPNKMKVYAKIVSVGSVSEEGIRRLNVKIGSAGAISALSTDIFSFKSARELNASKAAAAAASGVLRIPFFSSSAPKKAASSATTLSGKQAAGSGKGGAPASAATADENSIGRSELLGAVNGLLARAGVPLDMEQQVRMRRLTKFLEYLLLFLIFLYLMIPTTDCIFTELGSAYLGAGGSEEAHGEGTPG